MNQGGQARQIADRALKLHRAGKLDQAIPLYKQALELDPDLSYVYTSLGVAQRAKGNCAAAIACYRRALELDPDNGVIYSNMGNALRQAGQIEEAIHSQRQAIELNPTDPEAHYNCGVALKSAGCLEEALACFDRACQMSPEHVEAHWDRALVLLHLGRYQEGWPAYEWRWRRKDNPPPKLAQPRWDGAPFPDQTLLLYSEQGFGDAIQFIRYAPLVKQLGGRVIFECKRELYRLFQSVEGIDELVIRGSSAPHFDLQCPLLSVPGLLGTTVETIPGRTPYLAAPPAERRKFEPLLAKARGRLKVGIVWSGSVTFHANHLRAATLSRFLDLLKVPNIQLFSLQMGPPQAELRGFDVEALITDLTPPIDDFADTAAVIEQLDLVIMTDSSVAHLTGALHQPIWNILCFMPDWRWFWQRPDSPWYPSMRLFRQHAHDQWDAVFEEVIEALREEVARRQPATTISAQETLLDSAFTDARGTPRFQMPIPDRWLRDAGISYLWKHETTFGGYEYPTRKFLEEHLQPGDLFIDVGAHWGIYTLTAATRWPGQIQVLAVEPHPENQRQLQRWVRHNQVQEHVELVAAAAGASEGNVELEPNSTMGFRVASALDANNSRRVRVPMVTLDRLLAERPPWARRRTWIKIDVEGLEPDVVQGATQLLRSGQVAGVIWEKGRDFLQPPGYDRMLRMIGQLREAGLAMYRFPHEGLGGPLIPFLVNQELCNVFALAPGVKKLDVYDKPFGPLPTVFRPEMPEPSPTQRMQWTQQLIDARATDAGRWVELTGLPAGADARAEFAARFIDPHQSVLDLGAGTMALRAYLSEESRYTPLDLVKRSDDCLVGDLNQGHFPSGSFDCVTLLDVLQYIHDAPALLRRVAQAAPGLLLYYCIHQSEPVAERRAQGWFNDFTHLQLTQLLNQCGWTLLQSWPHQKAVMYVCRRGG